MAKRIIFLLLAASLLAMPGIAVLADNGFSNQLDTHWQYHIDIELHSAPFPGQAVTVFIDFLRILRDVANTRQFDANSVRVVSMTSAGTVSEEIPSILEYRIGDIRGWGYVTWLKGNESNYRIYFDVITASKGKKSPQYQIPEFLQKSTINLISNPSFEIMTGNRDLPDAWRFAGQDAKTFEWHNEPAFVSQVFSMSTKYAHSGKNSLRWDYGKAAEIWHDINSNPTFRNDEIPTMGGCQFNIGAYAYIESGKSVIPGFLNQSSNEGWLCETRLTATETTKGKWVIMTGRGVIRKDAVRLSMNLSAFPSASDSVFYLDDFNLQMEYPEPMEMLLNRPAYLLSDAKALVSLSLNINRDVLMPLAAQLAIGSTTKLVTVGLKTYMTEDYLSDRNIRYTIERGGKVVLSGTVPAQNEVDLVFDIEKFKAGVYNLKLSLLDKNGKVEFVKSRTFKLARGPFD